MEKGKRKQDEGQRHTHCRKKGQQKKKKGTFCPEDDRGSWEDRRGPRTAEGTKSKGRGQSCAEKKWSKV